MKKRLISLVLAVVMVFGTFSVAFADNTSDAQLRFDDNGKFRIMHVTDTHLEDYNVDGSVWAIAQACDVENPDLVVITGDNVQNTGDKAQTKMLIDKLMGVFEQRNIPVAVTFGNHDSEHEKGMTREELMAYYNSFSCSVSVDDGEALSGCGTYNLPVLASDGDKVGFNVWVFDSGDYDENGKYSCVQPDQIEWYKAQSDALKEANGGETVYSLAFQHIIVAEVYDALEKTDGKELFAFEHLYNDGEYYRFNPEYENYGTLSETPCPGYKNFGQFEAMVEQGDVLAMFTGHDHTNAFGVKYKGIDIVNSLSTRYNGDRYSTQYGYRILDIDEKNPSEYSSRVVHWYELFDLAKVDEIRKSGDSEGFITALGILIQGFFQKVILAVSRGFSDIVTGRQITYAD